MYGVPLVTERRNLGRRRDGKVGGGGQIKDECPSSVV